MKWKKKIPKSPPGENPDGILGETRRKAGTKRKVVGSKKSLEQQLSTDQQFNTDARLFLP